MVDLSFPKRRRSGFLHRARNNRPLSPFFREQEGVHKPSQVLAPYLSWQSQTSGPGPCWQPKEGMNNIERLALGSQPPFCVSSRRRRLRAAGGLGKASLRLSYLKATVSSQTPRCVSLGLIFSPTTSSFLCSWWWALSWHNARCPMGAWRWVLSGHSTARLPRGGCACDHPWRPSGNQESALCWTVLSTGIL